MFEWLKLPEASFRSCPCLCCLLTDDEEAMIPWPTLSAAIFVGWVGCRRQHGTMTGNNWLTDWLTFRLCCQSDSVVLNDLSDLSFSRSWDEFHDCANVAMAGCPQEAAVVWESLRQESRKMQFSGNLYDMCSNRSLSPRVTPRRNEINQESLRGHAQQLTGLHFLVVPVSLLLMFWMTVNDVDECT